MERVDIAERVKTVTKQAKQPVLMNQIFARTMEWLTWVGIIIMAIPGLGYFLGTKGFVGISAACANWDKPASVFWQVTKGVKISDIIFIDNCKCMDCLSLVGIMVLSLVSIFSLMFTIPRMDTKYRIMTGIVIIEFIVVVMRPFLAGVINI